MYAILGVERQCSRKAVDTAFRQAALRHHPDKGGTSAAFQTVKRAHDVLSDAEKRNIYDDVRLRATTRRVIGPMWVPSRSHDRAQDPATAGRSTTTSSHDPCARPSTATSSARQRPGFKFGGVQSEPKSGGHMPHNAHGASESTARQPTQHQHAQQARAQGQDTPAPTTCRPSGAHWGRDCGHCADCRHQSSKKVQKQQIFSDMFRQSPTIFGAKPRLKRFSPYAR